MKSDLVRFTQMVFGNQAGSGGPFGSGADDLAHALEPEGGASGTLLGSGERAASPVIGEGEFELI